MLDLEVVVVYTYNDERKFIHHSVKHACRDGGDWLGRRKHRHRLRSIAATFGPYMTRKQKQRIKRALSRGML